MALAENDYQGQLKEFNNKYGMEGYDLKKTAGIDEKFRYLNNFLMKDSVDGPSGQFVDWLSKVVRSYFEKHSQFASDWKKNLSKFHSQEFLDDFEKVAKAKYLSELEVGQEPNRKPYAGAKRKHILLAITPYFQEINKPLPTVWMERMKKGTMDVTVLQKRCVDLTDLLRDNLDQKATMMETFTNIVAAREAVRQLRESRPRGILGALWWLFNFRINGRERDCLEALNTCITTWEAQQFNTEKVLGELMGKTALGRPVNGAEKANQPQTQAAEQIQNEPSVNTELNNASKQEEKTPQMDPVAKQLDETLKKVDSYAMGQELHAKLPANDQMDILRTMGFQTLWKTASKNIGQINADFDSAIATGADPQVEMDHVVRKLFVDAFKAVKAWGDYSAMEDKIEATKIMAKTMLERHTALALHSDKLGDAVNGYVEQYTNTMKELSKQNKDFISEMEKFEFNRMNGVSNNNNEIKANKIEEEEVQSSNNKGFEFNDDDSDDGEIGFEDDDSSRSEEEINLDLGGNYTDNKEKVFTDANPFEEDKNIEKAKPISLDDSDLSESIDLNF